MNRLILVAAGALAAGSAAAALSMGSSNADPNAGGTMNILGEPYYKAVAILHAQGIQTVFGGSVGSDVPRIKCIVQSQKYLASGKMSLMLNCEGRPAGGSAAELGRHRTRRAHDSRRWRWPPDTGSSRHGDRDADSGRLTGPVG